MMNIKGINVPHVLCKWLRPSLCPVFDLSWQLYPQLIHQQSPNSIMPPMFTQSRQATVSSQQTPTASKQPTRRFISSRDLPHVDAVRFTSKDFPVIFISSLCWQQIQQSGWEIIFPAVSSSFIIIVCLPSPKAFSDLSTRGPHILKLFVFKTKWKDKALKFD